MKKSNRIDIIIGKLKGKPEHEDEEQDKSLIKSMIKDKDEESEDSDEGLKAAADELIEAIQSNDAEGVVQALKSFFDQC